MNNLLSPGTPEEVVPLSELMPPVAPTTGLPEAAARNRASTLGLLTDAPVENYQAIMAENAQGTENIAKNIEGQVANKSEKLDTSTLVNILGDKSVPHEQKMKLIKEFNSKRQFNATTELHTQSIAAPSEGETKQNEVARISVADQWRKAEESRVKIEGMITKAMADLDSSTGHGLLDIAATTLPLAGNIITGRVAKGQKGTSLWDAVKAGAWQPGYQEKQRQMFLNLPPEERVAYVSDLIASIKGNAGVLFPGSNHYAQYQMLRAITEEGAYTDWDKAADAVATVADVVGLGFTARAAKTSIKARGVVGAAQEALTPRMGAFAKKETVPVVEAPKASDVPPSKAPSSGYTSEPLPTPQINNVPAHLTAKVDALEKEYATLLEDGGLAGKGDIRKLQEEKDALLKKAGVADADIKELAKRLQKSGKLSYKDALKEATKRIGDLSEDTQSQLARIEKAITENAGSAKTQQRMGEIETELTSLKKQIKNETTVGPARKTQVASLLENYDQATRIELNAAVRLDHPSAPLHVFAQTNPEKYRATIAAIDADTTGEAAKAFAATTREETLASAVLPQLVTSSGKIAAKVVDPFREIAPLTEHLEEVSNVAGAMHLTKDEQGRAMKAFTEGFKNPTGIVAHDGMGGFGITQDGARFKIGATYGTAEGAFSNAEDAVKQTMLSLRGYGVTEDQITVLIKDGLDYKPIPYKDAVGKEGNFLVRLEGEFDFNFNDIGKFDGYGVRWTFFDRYLAGAKNNVSRIFLDPASMIDPTLTTGVTTGLDRAAYIDKHLLRYAYAYSDQVKGFPAARRKAIDDFLKEANDKSIPFDRGQLLLKFSPEEVDAIHSWKVMGDQQYHLENRDLIKSLSNKNYQKYVSTYGDEFIARPVGKTTNTGKIAVGLNQTVGRVYDPSVGTGVFHTKAETDMLYSAGGTYAELRRPADINGELFTHIAVHNDTDGFLRRLSRNDQVLNYRPMHYTRYYSAPKWVDKITPGGIRKAIAVGPDTPSAEVYAKHMNDNSTDGSKYVARGDERSSVAGADDLWDVSEASGRIAQRHRGKTLGTTDNTTILGEGDFVLDPTNSAIRAAQSLSSRIAMRDSIETAKARVVSQYGHMFKDGQFPSKMEDIHTKGDFTSVELSKARQSVGFIHYLEEAHINSVDDFWKKSMNIIADELGKAGLGGAERIVRKGEGFSPTVATRGTVFQAYIVLGNMVRQFLLQAHGGIKTFGYAPKNWANGQMFKDVGESIAWAFDRDKTSPFIKFMDEGGIIASVDRHTLVKGALSDIAEQRSHLSTIAHAGLVELPRRAGFDAGENMMQTMLHSAVYRKMESEGIDMTIKENRQIAYEQIRALGGEMNKAGELSYNSGNFSVLTQFMQMPQKAFLMYSNKKLPKDAKVRMALTELVAYGAPVGIISSMFGGDILPDNPEMRYLVSEGIVASMYNRIFKEATEDIQDLDFSWLNPYGTDGIAKMLVHAKRLEFDKVLKQAPAYSLLNPENGKFPKALKEFGRMFSGDIESDVPPATWKSVLQLTAEISSGYSAYSRANAALVSHEFKDQYGNPLIGEATPGAVFMAGFGVGLLNQREAFELSMSKSVRDKDFKDEVIRDVKETNRILVMALNKPAQDWDVYVRATNIMMNKWANVPEAQKIIMEQYKFIMTTPDNKLIRGAMKNSGIPDVGYTPDQIKRLPVDDETKKILLERSREIENSLKVKKD